MTCKEVQSRYIPFIDDKLSKKELQGFLKHIHSCDKCKEEYDIYYTMITGMRYLEEDNGKSEFKVDSEEKLKSAEEYLIKYRIFFVEKVLLLVILCLIVILFI